MQKYSVSEIVQRFAVPEAKVRRRIKKGLLPVVKEREGHQDVIKVLVESEEMLMAIIEGREFHIKHCEPETTVEAEFTSSIQEVKESSNTIVLGDSHFEDDMPLQYILKDLYKHNKNLTEDIKKYAELAGQAKLLTDSENRTKEQYFQVIQEKAELKAKLELQEQKFEELQTKLKDYENKSLSSWLKKL